MDRMSLPEESASFSAHPKRLHSGKLISSDRGFISSLGGVMQASLASEAHASAAYRYW